jgi:hypothetical protein
MFGRRLLLLAVGLSACAGELREPLVTTPAPLLAAFAPAPASSPASSAAPAPARARPRKDRGPVDRDFVVTHFSVGVFSTIVVSPATYFIAAKIGETGQGLAPAIGALLIGAFVPPILNYTVQWAAGRQVARGRDRFWPGWLVRQAVHLGIFAGAVAGGADFRNLGHATGIVLGEALLGAGLATMTAELTRRPRPVPANPAATVLVPLVEVHF